MALANDFQSIGEKLVSSYEDRLKDIAEIKYYVNQLLEQAAVDRMQNSREMWDKLQEARSNRLNEITELLDQYVQDRSEARKSWAQTLKTLDKIRAS